MAGTVIADKVQAASTSTLEIMNGVALTPPLIEDVNGVQVGTFCRAWVNFDASSGTPTIKESFNVTSLTDGGVGIFTVNFTNAMPDANYAITGYAKRNSDGDSQQAMISSRLSDSKTTSSVLLRSGTYNAYIDSKDVGIAFFR
jgi:hypothetical protein